MKAKWEREGGREGGREGRAGGNMKFSSFLKEEQNFNDVCWGEQFIFDSRIVRRTVCESMPLRVQKLLQWVVALENQHAIRAVCKGTPTNAY